MAGHPHIAMFRRAHEAFERGDTEAMRSWFADDFVWHEPGPLTGDYPGADEVFGLFGRIARTTDGHFDTHLEGVLGVPYSYSSNGTLRTLAVAMSPARRLGMTT